MLEMEEKMIILSQDEKQILNFDLIQILEINTPKTFGQGFYSIDTYPHTEDAQKFHIRLGKYETEERAKEVLQEIIKTYLDCNITSYGANFAYVKNSRI